MVFSEEEKQLIFGRLSYDASDFVEREYGEEAAEEFFGLFSAGFTKDEWRQVMHVNKTINSVYYRRTFELCRMMYEKEDLNEMYEEHGEPPAVDFSSIPSKTLQIGLLLAWRETVLYKKDDEDPEKFERRKDHHDFLFGHVNLEPGNA